MRSLPNAPQGPAGWEAELELCFARQAGRTVLDRIRHRGPLQVQKALYPEGGETCHIAVLHPPGGIAAGDRLRIRASLGERSHALLTTPGATKWYRSEGRRASQEVHFSLGEEAALEWLPRESILFDGANVSMELNVELGLRARYFGWEILGFGRRASGESWGRGTLNMQTNIRGAGRLLWSEVAQLDAASGFAASPVGLSGFAVCGTFLIAGGDIDAALLRECREVRAPAAQSRAGITRVPDVLIARYLGASTEEVFHWFTNLWTVLRPALSEKTACPPRVWAC
ncbi:MAG TPA: urease accessory protein UreD [Steroidobacteraceae bacterium]|nr:urease accessory protein UreD [Steroidobacteraceae bacterium]